MTGLAYALLGAILVAIGVVAGGFADRVRGIRFVRVAVPRERTRRSAPAGRAMSDATESHQVEPVRSNRRRARSFPLGAPQLNLVDAEDVIAALVAAGFKKPIATEAACGCSEAERTTIEEWTRAALRRTKGVA